MSTENVAAPDEPSPGGRSAPRGVPVGDDVYEALLSRILSSDLKPGDRVTIDALGRELRVSQTPIREALHRLAAGGIVVRTHMAGYRVAPIMSREQFEDLVEVRLLLEPAAARHAAGRADADDVKRLRALSAEMAATESNEDPRRAYATFSRLDTQLHDELAWVGGNAIIRESLHRLHPHVHIFRLGCTPAITELAVLEHDAIIDAVAVADSEGAAYAMRRHIEASAERFRRRFGEDAADTL